MLETLILLVIALVSSGVISLVIVLRLANRVKRLEAAVSLLERRLRAPAAPIDVQVPVPAYSTIPPIPAGAADSIPTETYRPPIEPKRRPAVPVEDRLSAFERLVGTRWLNWVEALVMTVGIAFLLKFLYDRGWIGPPGRVAICMGFGIGLLFLGEFRLRHLHPLLSQSVSAAGCSALFLTTFLSFKFYEFNSRGLTFALLCWFALFTMALAVMRRARILGFLGLLGAYLTPYLLSTGQDQAEGLFAYLAVLSLVAAGVQAVRGWRGIPSLTFGFNWIYYVGWFSSFYRAERLPIAVAGAAGIILLPGIVALARGLAMRSAVRIEEYPDAPEMPAARSPTTGRSATESPCSRPAGRVAGAWRGRGHHRLDPLEDSPGPGLGGAGIARAHLSVVLHSNFLLIFAHSAAVRRSLQ